MYRYKTTIGFAKTSDVKEISALSRQYIEYDLGWKYTPQKVRNLLKSNNKNVVVARAGGRITGFGIMTYQEEQANLDLLAVKGPDQRQGTGRQILEWLEDVALAAGIVIIFVQVRKINAGAIKFYKRQGFDVIEEIQGYYHGRETALIMAKNIRGMIMLREDPIKRETYKPD